jgi:hypothetical protein
MGKMEGEMGKVDGEMGADGERWEKKPEEAGGVTAHHVGVSPVEKTEERKEDLVKEGCPGEPNLAELSGRH